MKTIMKMGVAAVKPKAVVLLSGGLDSATVLAIAQSKGFECHCISFDYGQRHKIELTAAQSVADAAKAKLVCAKIDLRLFGGSALTSDQIDVPKDRDEKALASSEIPSTYVPARNTIFLSYALAYAEVLKANEIFLGVNAVDYSGYPDCRPDYIAAYEHMARIATKTGITGETTLKIQAPLMEMNKPEIIETGLKLNVDYALTHSCYDPSPEGKPCLHCDSCSIRTHAFEKIGKTDPAFAKWGIKK